MPAQTRRWLLYGALVALFVLHNDLWLWNDTRLVFGLPIGLTYHVGFCIVTSVVLAALVSWAWPDFEALGVDPDDHAGPRAGDGSR
jgi:hypothetical protein